MPRPPILINRLDAERIQRLIDNASEKDAETAEALELELERGEVVEPEDIPNDIASMNSRVMFMDLKHNKQLTRTLVYPHALANTEDGISILAPIGAALLGLKVGNIIDWPLPGGEKVELRIDEILWQPEAAKQFHR
ncbi:nucleoside diphosphate kinase regulator [Chromohalobacter japonicus]|uniref:Nucleoside diphosphate kinase regulator n=1 Tax=Chromohalobacter japonicus TaxID=223900 RepID=A0A1Q8TGV3_9GAMM|nr:nucleoside diphosphate kinase regulator [Chromohalobacter japonicus]OLO12888.1 nucleoside diphosphate kinase regulator [Chromohalobacter japonicus]